MLSTIHHARGVKDPGVMSLDSIPLQWFSLLMAGSLILNIGLGVWMAIKFGHKTIALTCLGVGLILPVGLAWISAR
jgi:hypothetical protein